MAFNFTGIPANALPPISVGPMGSLSAITNAQNFIDLTSQGFPPLPPPIPIPGINDTPLEFNTNKNQPPIIRESMTEETTERKGDKNERRDRDRDNRDNGRRQRDRSDRRDRDRDRREERSERDRREDRRTDNRENTITTSISNNQNNTNNQIITSNANSNNSQVIAASIESTPGIWSMGIGYPLVGIGPMGPIVGEVPLGPHLSHAHGFGPMGMSMITPEGAIVSAQMFGNEQIISEAANQIASCSLPNNTVQGTKEIIHCKGCTLFPPNPNAPPPTTRERPPGCRTIFVGGLPENINEGIIQEIFERCGEIATLRLSKKNFCHIRFVSESSVDSAIYLSGYRVRIGSNSDSPNSGRLHVDYAQARDDQYEWECKQRQLQREQRHRERVEKERQRQVASPPPVVHYTDHEASNVCEKIKQDDSFMKAVQIIITWLERGDCTKRNANTFYSMIQTTNSHVRRLISEKAMYEEELQKAKELLKGRMQGLLIQFSQIERVFNAASHKKVWDHFTKAQRKNIEMWKKQSLEIKTVQLEDTAIDGLMEMEVSDSEDEVQRRKSKPNNIGEDNDKVQTLKEENDSLRCQLEAYKNEVDLLKSETKVELDNKSKQIKMLQQTLKGMHEQLIHSKKQLVEGDQKLKDLTFKLNNNKKEEFEENEVITLDKDDSDDEQKTSKLFTSTSAFTQINQKDAKLMGLIAIFLHIHPFGASLDYILCYLQKLEPCLRINEVESLMQRFPQVFKQEICGIGASMERRWQFSGFTYNRNHQIQN